jgi:AbrB family looped-hinge helix DNA binding protein
MEVDMAQLTVSQKYQVVIPLEIREAMGIKPGEKVQVFQYGDRIEFVPIRTMSEMRGFLPGIETEVEREEEP